MQEICSMMLRGPNNALKMDNHSFELVLRVELSPHPVTIPSTDSCEMSVESFRRCVKQTSTFCIRNVAAPKKIHE
jgi:hypothetical protein